MADQILNRRRFLALIAASGASALLAACGGTAPAEAPTSAPVAAAPTTAPAEAPTAAATAAMAEPTAAMAEPTAAMAEPTTASAPTAGAAAAATTAPVAGSAGPKTPPADAAPAEQQVYVVHYDSTASSFTTLDFYQSVYQRGGAISDVFSDPLVRLNKNFEVIPAAATSWSSNTEGTEWSFKLDPNLMWSDDTPVTADDYVATLMYGADPKHAWDFTWFFNGVIKNWDEVVAGTVPLDQLGVKAGDANTLVVTTQSPAPYLPAMMLYSNPLQKKALEAKGGLYNADPATSVSAGPYLLKEWNKGERVVYEINPKYKGTNAPYVQKIICIGAAPNTDFTSYQNNEIDFVSGANLTPADNEIIAGDPELSKEVHTNFNDFRTDYLFFDTKNPPFDKVEVRQAFSHMIDRDTLINQIIKPSQGIPAYSFLMPGFPASNSEGLKGIQNYDPAKAKELLAAAGYPNGQGFPKLTLWLRNESDVRQAVAQAIAATIKQELGIDVEVSNKEQKTFTDAMNAKPTQIQFGMVSYGMDFLDPYNMLSVWLGGGRHNWNNADFDKQVKTAAALVGDDAKRTQMFQDAEKLLVTEAPGVFIYHRTVGDIYRPYLKGSELEPDKNGVAALHWPGFSNYSASVGSIYIANDVTQVPPEPTRIIACSCVLSGCFAAQHASLAHALAMGQAAHAQSSAHAIAASLKQELGSGIGPVHYHTRVPQRVTSMFIAACHLPRAFEVIYAPLYS